jgi:hypothetical protein
MKRSSFSALFTFNDLTFDFEMEQNGISPNPNLVQRGRLRLSNLLPVDTN